MAQTSLEKYRKIAERYTNALLKIAQENGSIQQIADDLKQIIGAFSTNPDIENFFTSPIISKEDKKEILEKSFKNKINESLYNFLNILVDKNRMYILTAIENIYAEKLAISANILNVEAQSVIALDYDMQRALIEKMEAMTGKKVILSNKINKEIIGGVILSFDGKVIDGSVKTQLESLQKQLI